MTTLDALLGWVELALVPVSLAWLAVAIRRGWRRRWPLLLVAVTALTVAHPFGVVRDPITPAEFAAGSPTPADPHATRTLRVLGLPLVSFRPLARENPWAAEGDDPTWMKVRSWVGLPLLLTNATKLERMCDSVSSPCWLPDGDLPYNDPRHLELVEADGEWRYRILDGYGRASEPSGARWGDGHYRVGFGVVSRFGLAYWAIAAVLVAIALWPPASRVFARSPAPARDQPREHDLGAGADD